MIKNDECNDNQNDKKNEKKYFKDFQCVAGSVLHNHNELVQIVECSELS